MGAKLNDVSTNGSLVLKRKNEECVRLTTPNGEVIRIQVMHCSHGNCKLRFIADRSISIIREELLAEPAA